MKLGEALRASNGIGPGFHFLRHFLSVAILLHHCRVMVIGYVENQSASKGSLSAALSYNELIVEIMRPSLYALVGMFFALSGFLVTGSALRNPSVANFFTNRILRIVPALSVEVTLSALILGPLVTTVSLASYFSGPDFLKYFGNIIGLVHFELPGVFTTNPWPRVVNGNLWTLPPEFWCYAIMLVLMVTGMLVRRRALLVSMAVVIAIIIALGAWDAQNFSVKLDNTRYQTWYIVTLFLLGALFYIRGDSIPLRLDLFMLSCASYYMSILFNVLPAASGIFLTYCMVYIGFCRFDIFDRLVKSDYSYGIYLYGWPISQFVIWLLLPYLGEMRSSMKAAMIMPISCAITFAFAAGSWRLVERPALSLKRLMPRNRPLSASS